MASYNDIVPQKLQDELIRIRDRQTRDSFRVGDIVLMVQDNCDKQKIMVEKETIYSAVGLFVGKAARTIREYASISRRYNVELRHRFEVLSFDHFRNALPMGEGKDVDALEWCVQQGDILGRPATVDAMVAKFLGGSSIPTGDENFKNSSGGGYRSGSDNDSSSHAAGDNSDNSSTSVGVIKNPHLMNMKLYAQRIISEIDSLLANNSSGITQLALQSYKTYLSDMISALNRRGV